MHTLSLGQYIEMGGGYAGKIIEIEDLTIRLKGTRKGQDRLFAMQKTNLILHSPDPLVRQAAHTSLIEGIQHRIAREVQEGTPTTIYRLDDPRTQATHYVGCARDPHQRFQEHLACHDSNQRKRAWIRALQQQGLQPVLVLLEVVLSPTYARIREDFWISQYRPQQAPLLNSPLFDELFGAAITLIRGATLALPPQTLLFSLPDG